MKINTLNQLVDVLDEDFAWRLKELADLKILHRQSESSRKVSVIRAGIPLGYAHWEGFVKSGAQWYLEHVLAQKVKAKNLKPFILALSKRKLLNEFEESRRTEIHNQLVSELTEAIYLEKVISFSSTINTKSNLNSEVFTNIANSIGIDLTSYETKFKFMDESLLSRRNKIAHGNYLDVDDVLFPDIINSVISLLRMFKSDILNNATLKKYKYVS